jgi:hypothetical protein
MSLHPMPNKEFYELVDVFGLDVKKETKWIISLFCCSLDSAAQNS